MSQEGEEIRADDLEALYPAVLAFFRARLTRSRRSLADALASDTLRTGLVRWAAERSGHDPVSFLYEIAREKLEGASRDRATRQAVEHRRASELARRVAVEAARIEERRLRALRVALRRLDARERQIIDLRHGLELSEVDAAARMDMEPAEARRLTDQALAKLRARLTRH